MILSSHRSSLCFRSVCVSLLLTFGVFSLQGLLAPASVWAATPQEDLATAYQLWQNALFPEAQTALEKLVKRDGLSKDVKREAYLLLGQCRVAMAGASDPGVRDAFCQAVEADPDWDLKSGSVTLSGPELQVYAEARNDCAPKGMSKLLIGGLVLGLGGLALLLIDDKPPLPSEPLPDFPCPPGADCSQGN